MKKHIAIFLAVAALCSAGNCFANDKTVTKLNSLLRGEISAIETYQQALKKVGDEPQAPTVRAMMKDHSDAADSLRTQIAQLGGKPSTESGAWGAWAATVTGAAKIFGDDAALGALKEGEEHGLDEYKEALEMKELPTATRQVIQERLLPKQQQHIQTLARLIDTN